MLISNVASSLAREVVDVSRNQTGSRLVEELIQFFSWEQLKCILESFSKHWDLIVIDRFAHRVLQRMIDRFQHLFVNADDTTFAEAAVSWSSFLQHMRSHYPEYLEHTYGCFSLRSYLLLISGIFLKKSGVGFSSSKSKHDSLEKADAVLFKPITIEETHYKVELKNFGTRFLLTKHVKALIDSDVTGPFLQCLLLVLSQRLPKTFKKVVKFLLMESGLFSSEVERTLDNDIIRIPAIFSEEKSSYFVEQLVALMPPKSLKQFIASHITGKERHLSLHRISSFILQRAIIQNSDTDYLSNLLETLGHHIEEILAAGQHGILLSLARSCKKLESNCANMIRNLLRSMQCNEAGKQGKFLDCLAHLVTYSQLTPDVQLSVPGCLLVQELFSYPNPKVLVNSLLGRSAPELAALCRDPKGSHIVEAFLSSQSAGQEAKHRFLSSIQGVLVDIACDKYGSHIMDSLWSTFDMKSREGITQLLTGDCERLRNDQFGRFTFKKFAPAIYSRKLAEWREYQKTLDKGSRIVGIKRPTPSTDKMSAAAFKKRKTD